MTRLAGREWEVPVKRAHLYTDYLHIGVRWRVVQIESIPIPSNGVRNVRIRREKKYRIEPNIDKVMVVNTGSVAVAEIVYTGGV